jgi:hypothetical protein
MSSKSSDDNRETLEDSAPEEPEQSSPTQTAELEGAARSGIPTIPRRQNTPIMKVRS